MAPREAWYRLVLLITAFDVDPERIGVVRVEYVRSDRLKVAACCRSKIPTVGVWWAGPAIPLPLMIGKFQGGRLIDDWKISYATGALG
ncbi:hypothetical protein BRADI_1g07683v3 [Brachypodium distachyon]|uniref:Uncharacterized protein n=1 Tax=Brachypodium distachyon TaxID=15368 RepID=A0A2K2DII8_BRADI|nr:hypothetical protein BRADI_1g07683v3 [Brachypodium distachyon]